MAEIAHFDLFKRSALTAVSSLPLDTVVTKESDGLILVAVGAFVNVLSLPGIKLELMLLIAAYFFNKSIFIL